MYYVAEDFLPFFFYLFRSLYLLLIFCIMDALKLIDELDQSSEPTAGGDAPSFSLFTLNLLFFYFFSFKKSRYLPLSLSLSPDLEILRMSSGRQQHGARDKEPPRLYKAREKNCRNRSSSSFFFYYMTTSSIYASHSIALLSLSFSLSFTHFFPVDGNVDRVIRIGRHTSV